MMCFGFCSSLETQKFLLRATVSADTGNFIGFNDLQCFCVACDCLSFSERLYLIRLILVSGYQTSYAVEVFTLSVLIELCAGFFIC